MKKLRVGIIGLGGIARSHCDAIATLLTKVCQYEISNSSLIIPIRSAERRRGQHKKDRTSDE